MKLALAGDTMLGREVAKHLAVTRPTELFAPEVAAAVREADLFLLNLECAVSDRGTPWADPSKPFFFRAPPAAVGVLRHLGVDCVTLANNHALDFGATALLDTIDHLSEAGIAAVGAGADQAAARAPVVLERDGWRVGILGVTDHPQEYAAGTASPGVAYANLRAGVPGWLLDAVGAVDADVVVVTPHWGPNMVDRPLAYVRATASTLRAAGVTLVAGHSAHVFHGVGDRVLFDLGDFIDDYAVDSTLRNDLGLLFLVTFADHRPVRLDAVPLALDCCYTRLATEPEGRWIGQRFRRACADLGSHVVQRDHRLVVEWE